MSKVIELEQISNYVYCDSKLNNMDIESKLLPNPYYDYPFMVIEDFFNDSECDTVNSYIKEKNEFKIAKLKTKNHINVQGQKVNRKIRNTNIYKLDKTLERIYYDRFKLFQNSIEDFFKLVITSNTELQSLEYKEGFFYKAHSDDSSMLYEGDELVGFNLVAKERKITTVLFTKSWNEDFIGGELRFNFLYDTNFKNIEFKPKKGQMIAFLSNPYFTHEVLPIKKGTRNSLVQWHNSFGD